MYNSGYRGRSSYSSRNRRSRSHKGAWFAVLLLIAIAVVGGLVYKFVIAAETPAEKSVTKLQFDSTVTPAEQQEIAKAIKAQAIAFDGSIKVSVSTTFDATNTANVLNAYVPVTNVYAPRQTVTKDELSSLPLYISPKIVGDARSSIAEILQIDATKLTETSSTVDDLNTMDVAIVPASQLSTNVKLLRLDDGYYLDTFQKGALFRQAIFTGKDSAKLSSLKLNSLPAKDTTFTVNQTGVTALTRIMMKKLNQVGDPTYFSKDIGAFLAATDLTHISNEVSFKAGCGYSNTAFCSDPRFIETLKASGIDLVELTGNHNNDTGNEYNTETINLYHSLGWKTFGGGLNTAEAAKFYLADQKKSKVAFLGYNYPDSPSGTPIAHATTAGANSFDFDKIKKDIETAKTQSNFVIVDVQFWECYAYPAGFVEYPECDQPIGDQKEVFRRLVDLGADMVVGTQAHQPQTYELYKGKPIYYGLGNLYFDQTQWPGTERGIILTHYFVGGKLIQTKLSPTVYDTALQTRLMTDAAAVSLLERLNAAR